MTSPSLSPRAARPAPLDGLLLLTIYLFIAALALAFLWPLRQSLFAEPSGLDRYSPLEDGGSALLVRYDPNGEPILWQSQNIAVLPTTNAIATLLRPAPRDLLIERYPSVLETGQVPDTIIFELRQREQGADGTSQAFVNVVVREPRGEFYVGFYDPANDQDFIFNPPILTLPNDLGPERDPWETEGTLSNGVGFRSASRITDAGPHQNAVGSFDDCLQIETTLRLFSGDETLSDTTSQDWTCAGVGLVEGRFLEGGTLQYSTVVVASTTYDHATLDAFPPLPATVTAPTPDAGSVTTWQLSRVARSVPTGVASRSTIPPTWLPGEPPLLLAAGYASDLVAYDVSGPVARVQWRFHTGGTIYGPPAYDAARGRLFFGSTDKHLYALDRNGFFLWAFATGDNVATRPVLVGDMVIFGSEDRNVYALDVETGALRWQQSTGAAVVSSPAAADGTVFIGSDDGALYALDAATGETRWLFPTDNSIEAAIVVEEGVVYVASRDGTLYALDAASGEEKWGGRCWLFAAHRARRRQNGGLCGGRFWQAARLRAREWPPPVGHGGHGVYRPAAGSRRWGAGGRATMAPCPCSTSAAACSSSGPLTTAAAPPTRAATLSLVSPLAVLRCGWPTATRWCGSSAPPQARRARRAPLPSPGLGAAPRPLSAIASCSTAPSPTRGKRCWWTRR